MISDAARSELSAVLGERVRFGHSLARCTSLRVGGPVDAFATPADVDELRRALAVCRDQGLPTWVIGAGFNCIAPDAGLAGVLFQLGKLRALELSPAGDSVRVGAGVSHAQLTNFCVERGLAGLEFACGIPGTIGGWVAMNAGIPEREVSDAILSIEVLDPETLEARRIERDSLDFEYRSLRGLAPGTLIIAATFAVASSAREAVQAEVDRLLARRAGSQPLNVPSCGSVFKNPPQDHAGRLIEAAGLKGLQHGGAEISTLHANFITNRDGASASDVLALIERARSAVWQQAGIRMVPEVRILGEKP
jgi:UDP-N-acetylmuramate dehydrogenase